MFALRTLHIRRGVFTNLRQFSNIKKDPGIKKRTSIIDQHDLNEIDVELEDLETDFMDVHKSYKQHIRESERQKERLKYLIVKQKYFKQHFPNFLSWNDKEQIKHLHTTNPDEWTIERLSESFPALPDVIKKVIRAKYEKNKSRIEKHDLVVQKNWQMFESGQMTELPESLVEHLKKFTSRSKLLTVVEPSNEKQVVDNLSDRLPKGEFSEIISSYSPFVNKNEPEKNKSEISVNTGSFIKDHANEDSRYISKVTSKEQITLSCLEEKIKIKASRYGKVTEDDKLLLSSSEPKSDTSTAPFSLEEIDLTALLDNKFEVKTAIVETERDNRHLLYPETIIIPKDKLKRGLTYKLNDCYYDSDGKFLYRVPGMY